MSDLLVAEGEADVRYGPERSAIALALGEAKATRKADIGAAKAAARSAIIGARRARKPLRKIYNRATSAADVNAADVRAAFETLGQAADPFEAITTREMGAQKTRIAEAAAQAQKELRMREQEARVGRQYAVGQARQEFGSTRAQLRQRLQDIGDERGAYIVGRLGALREARAGRQTQRWVQREAGRQRAREGAREHEREKELIGLRGAEQRKTNRSSGGGGGRGGGGGGGASTSELRMFKTDYSKALRYANDYKAQKVRRSDAATTLIRGMKGAEGQSDVPSIDDQLALSVALDMAYDGHVSRQNAREMHRIGLRVADIPGARSYQQWAKRRRYPRSTTRRWGANYASPV